MLRDKLSFCERQLGINLPLNSALPHQMRFVSDVHAPFFHLPKFTRLFPHVVSDPEVAALFREEHIVCDDWAMALPNLAAILQDFSKYSHDEPDIVGVAAEDISWVVEAVVDYLSPACVGKDLTPEPLARAMLRMHMATSPGWPWNIKYRTKRAWVDAKIDHAAICKHYLETKCCFWNVSHKEEIRSLEKLLDNKSRSFMSGPAEENSSCLSYFGPLLRAVVDGWRLTPIIYGMNPRKRGWQLLLEQFGDFLAYGIDFSKFDGSLPRWMFWIVYRICCALVPDVAPEPGWPTAHVAMAAILISQLCSPCVFPTGLVGFKYVGNPSGSGLTIFVNSVIHLVLLLLYLRVVYKLDLDEIRESFHFNCLGDDGRHGADDSHIGQLNFTDMQAFFRGLGCTLEIKPENERPLPPEELVFCSQITVEYHETWVPTPEDPEKLLASAELRNDVQPPEGWHVKAYHLARLIQITNQLVFSEYWEPMNRVIDKYILLQLERLPELASDVSWAHALRHRKPKDLIVRSYVWSV